MSERPPTLGDRIDVIRGALDARQHPQLGPSDSRDSIPGRVSHLGGILAVMGGVLWAVSGIAFNSAPYDPGLGYKESGTSILIALAAALVTALAALTVWRSLSGRHIPLSISAVAALLGALAMPLPWPVVLFVFGYMTTIVANLVFGLVASPRLGPAGVILGGAALLALMFNTEDARALFLVPFGAAWILLGIVMAARGTPARVDAVPDIG